MAQDSNCFVSCQFSMSAEALFDNLQQSARPHSADAVSLFEEGPKPAPEMAMFGIRFC